ncbi:hypothetical protein [Streptomyces sp. NPDC049040]|uniref:hypothetical protein n=1 Tax=Streptomyces sp. NPDC049040 TaxID=3365593 RepID=UPI00370F9A06
MSSSICGRCSVADLVGSEGFDAGPVLAFAVPEEAADRDPEEGESPPQPLTPATSAAASTATLMILLARFTVPPAPALALLYPTRTWTPSAPLRFRTSLTRRVGTHSGRSRPAVDRRSQAEHGSFTPEEIAAARADLAGADAEYLSSPGATMYGPSRYNQNRRLGSVTR